jgi:hypothetical protein
MAWLTAPLQPRVPALQQTFSREGFAGVLAGWTAAGEDWRFARHFWLDVPFTLLYGGLGWRWRRYGLPAWLLVGAALADALENGLHLWFIGGPVHPSGGEAVVAAGAATAIPEAAYLLAGWAAMVKFKLLAVALLVVLHRRSRRRDV